MKTADPELMRAINRYHVIDVIRREGPIARVEIADRTELSRATVSAITGGLIEEGLVGVRRVETGEAGARGRPRVLLAIEGGACHVVGVKLSPHRLGVTVTDARGDPLGSLVLPVRLGRQTPDVIADLVEDGVRQCVADAKLAMSDISGVGVGLPGVIDAVAGVSQWSPILGPSPVRFADAVARRLGTRVSIENDANLVALAEHWFGIGQGLDTFAVVTVEDSVGMGLVLDGRLHRGAHGVGPEIGHLSVDPDGPECRCGRRGCLDALASDWGIVRAAIVCGDAPRDLPRIADVTRMAADGDAGLRAVFARAGRALGAAIASVVTTLNPPRLVLSGDGLRAGELLTGPMFEALDAMAPPAVRAATEIVLHPWGDETWARGAATIVLRQIYEAPWQNGA